MKHSLFKTEYIVMSDHINLLFDEVYNSEVKKFETTEKSSVGKTMQGGEECSLCA